MKPFHVPVLLKEVVQALRVQKGKKYIDATFGGGGHGIEIVKRGGIVLGIDIDPEAIEYTRRRWKIESRSLKIPEENLKSVWGNFKDIKAIALSNGWDKVSGILFDLGVSSHQLESENRGFSFQIDSSLDMRMDTTFGSAQAVTAADLVNGLTKKELYELFTRLAQEPNSWAISNSIVRARKIKPITTTKELADLVVGVYRRYGVRKTRINPATRIFQALRIAVNDELNNLREALPQTIDLLEDGGRLVVISFHSLEDRIVKEFMKDTAGPITPSDLEIKTNPRARSAKMRVLERYYQ